MVIASVVYGRIDSRAQRILLIYGVYGVMLADEPGWTRRSVRKSATAKARDPEVVVETFRRHLGEQGYPDIEVKVINNYRRDNRLEE